MNEICKAQYSNKSIGISARSVNLLDIEKNLTAKGISTRNAYVSVGNVKYGTTGTYKISGYRYYPSLYKNQKGSGINVTNVIQPDIIKGNDPYEESKKIATAEPTTDSSYGKASSKGLIVTQTMYYMQMNSENYGEAAKVLSTEDYWVAARCINTYDYGVDFELRCVSTSNNNAYIGASYIFDSCDHTNWNSNHYLRPLITISLSIFSGTKDSNGAWNLK